MIKLFTLDFVHLIVKLPKWTLRFTKFGSHSKYIILAKGKSYDLPVANTCLLQMAMFEDIIN